MFVSIEELASGMCARVRVRVHGLIKKDIDHIKGTWEKEKDEGGRKEGKRSGGGGGREARCEEQETRRR